jgi:hypothetical protein
MDYYGILDKGGTHFQKPSLLFNLVEKLAERREIARKEYCNLAMDHCPFAPHSNDAIRDVIIQFVADDIISMVSTAAHKNGLRAEMNPYVVRLREVLERYANKH